MSGTQESILYGKIDSYATAKKALDNAKKAPYSPTAERAMNDAQRARDRAWTDVQTAYNIYDKDMRGGGRTPSALSSILRSRGTSEH